MKKIIEVNGKKYKAIDENNQHPFKRVNKFSINSQGFVKKKPRCC